MFCGTGNFSHVDEDPSAPSTPKESKKKNKNPYSQRGLDKFSAVMAELEAKKEKIMAKSGSKDTAMVKFMYSNSNDWVPIIIKLKDDKKKPLTKISVPESPPSPVKEQPEVVPVPEKCKVAEKRCSLGRWRYHYWSMVMVLILFSLVLFGKVFAICCTSIWWYLVPSMHDGTNVRRRKKDYGRRLSDKKLGEASSPKHLVNHRRG
ncbi:uncharacterized protein LOC120257493 [Dioscorea cayenensis subsp. rotundata]|uniref:Uncharacterized protein LOC120257493 n=1 Tax=Dioscorea cayennensis subsp. rotundata TaxID=55577 RepID=A0AB40B124_DIOCR|nr:uncharacterized protein LOC120257493 [Dioscorea cayenensis subsp. rotundata]